MLGCSPWKRSSRVPAPGPGKAAWLLSYTLLLCCIFQYSNLHVPSSPSPRYAPTSQSSVKPSLCHSTQALPVRTHSPGSLVVKEKDKEELFSRLCLPLLPQLQHIQWWDWDGDSIVQQTLTRHLGIDYLVTQQGDS